MRHTTKTNSCKGKENEECQGRRIMPTFPTGTLTKHVAIILGTGVVDHRILGAVVILVRTAQSQRSSSSLSTSDNGKLHLPVNERDGNYSEGSNRQIQ